MIQDVALRWVVTLLFGFSAVVCIRAIIGNRHSAAAVISLSLHALMAIAMAVMAWPRGAELPTRAPMVIFAVAALWFAVMTGRNGGQRAANSYHTLMMLAMAWMYAAMGGLPLRTTAHPDMAGMDGMSGMSPSEHAGHGSHSGHAAGATAGWVGAVNWLFALGFGIAALFWLYRYITTGRQGKEEASGRRVGVLCQAAMASGMAIMFAVML